VAKLKPEQQVEAVRERLRLLNSGFDGKLSHKIENGHVMELRFISDEVTDISPVRALPLEELTCREAMARKNAPILAEIETLKTINGQPAAEFWKSNPSETR
jgi:hypothetical protein